jgi:hypothetical protein
MHMILASEVLTRYLTAQEGLEVLEFSRIVRLGSSEVVELFLVTRAGWYYVLSWERLGNLSFGIEAKSDSRSKATSDFRRILDKKTKGVQLMGSAGPVDKIETKLDQAAQQHLKIFDSPTFGVDWSKEVEDLASPEQDFLKYLVRQVGDWKASSVSLSLTGHEFWPEFQAMVLAAVHKKYGSSIKLYRGIYRDQAKEILDTQGSQPLAVHTYSSWAKSLAGAKAYRGDRRFDSWVVVQAVFSPKDIALAPVPLPDFIEPDVLLRFGSDVQSVGDELVVGPRRSVPNYRIVARTKKAAVDLWDYVPDDPDILDLEDAWKGGIADLGDQRAAQAIQHVPSYPQYIETVRSLVAESLGQSFTLYRSMSREQLDEWLQVKPRLQNFAFTSRKQVAMSWRNFAGHSKDNEMLVVSGVFSPEAVVMRGKAAEYELVISGMRLKPKDLRVVVDKQGSVHEDLIPGGLADKRKPGDFDPKALAQGIKVELEHTDDRGVAQEISMDHLTEDPKYYQKLEKMERTV